MASIDELKGVVTGWEIDVIPIGGILIMIGDDGLYQYDYKNVKDIKFLSKIGVK